MLFKNISIIDENFEVKNNMYVATEGDKIAYISDVKPEMAYGEEYDGTGKVLLPAFVNSHTHAAMTLMRGYGENLALSDWLTKKIFPFEDQLNPEAVYWATMLSMAESIRFGIVSSTDMYYFCDQVAKAVGDSGSKANISRSITQFDDSDLYQTERFAEAKDFFEQFHGSYDGRVKVDMSIHAEYTSNPDVVEKLGAYTKEIGANMHIHMSETKSEHEECKQRHGLTPVAYFKEHGALETPTVAAHCVWIEPEDYEILKEKGVTVAVNPISNLKLASGVCNVQKLFDAGINVAIGTDSVASNNSLNFIEEMKIFAIASKGFTGNPAIVSPKETLRAATLGGALGQGRMDCGLIKEGYKADLTVIDIDRPYMVPVHDLLNNLVYSASGSDVVLTMSDGKVLYKDGEYLTLDIEKVQAEAVEHTKKILALV